MNPILAAKLGAAMALLALAFYLGGLGPKAALERDHAAMAEATTQALLAQQKAAETEHARQQRIIDAYDAAPIDFVAPTLARRLYIAAVGGCDLPKARTVASGTEAPSPLPSGPSGVERALGELIEACSADARQLNAMIQLAP